MNKTKKQKKHKTKKHKTKKHKTKKHKKQIALNFNEVPINTPTSLYVTDYFGYRKSVPVNLYKTIQSIDNLNLATDYKKNSKIYKFASDEYRNRLLLLLQKSSASRKRFNKKTRKKYNKRNISKIIDKMPINKVQKIYDLLLEKEKQKLRK